MRTSTDVTSSDNTQSALNQSDMAFGRLLSHSARAMRPKSTRGPYPLTSLADLRRFFPGFVLLNQDCRTTDFPRDLTEDQINPRRVCFYFPDAEDDRRTSGDQAEISGRTATTRNRPVLGQGVRSGSNQYRATTEETGDELGYPLYVQVPKGATQQQITRFLDLIRRTYPEAFSDNSYFDSLYLTGHGVEQGAGMGFAAGVYTYDRNNYYNLLPDVQGGGEGLDLNDYTHLMVIEACALGKGMSNEDIQRTLAEARTSKTAIRINASENLINWGRNPRTDNYAHRTLCGDKQPTQTRDAHNGPGGNAFLFCPPGYVTPDGRQLRDGGILRIVQKGDAFTDRYTCGDDVEGLPLYRAWQRQGDSRDWTIDLTAAPNIVCKP